MTTTLQMRPTVTDAFHVYDTTLRDGAQQEGLNLSVADKIAIARHLDDLGVGFIEGGWPGAVPKDTEFFARARTELNLKTATFAAFGATRRPGTTADADPLVAALRESGAGVVTLVAKSHDQHVLRALRTSLDENLAMIEDTVRHLRASGQRVFLDAEHFFDGYRSDRAYALEVVRRAAEAGAEVVALCDTNGGTLPRELQDVVHDVLGSTGARLGIHCHNDAGCAVANSLAAVEAGVTHVQGTINGYGERTGNADLLAVVANLELKRGQALLPAGKLSEATRIAHAVAEVTNVPPSNRQPYVGVSAFAHEARGYTFEAADASFELLLHEEVGGARPSFFDVESWRVITESRADGEAVSESTVKLVAGGEREVVTGEGNGPVNALDHALRTAIERAYPVVGKFDLIDYKVRILDQGHGTDAVIRVLIETADGEGSWVTVGVGHNIVEASWEALVDGVTYGLLRHNEAPR